MGHGPHVAASVERVGETDGSQGQGFSFSVSVLNVQLLPSHISKSFYASLRARAAFLKSTDAFWKNKTYMN